MESKSELIGIALIQMKVVKDKDANLLRAGQLIDSAVKLYRPKLVVLPEFFQTPINSPQFSEYVEEEENSQTLKFLQEKAKQHSIFLVGGSFPVCKSEDSSKVYNTCFCIDDEGMLKTTFRKLHLYDVDIPGKLKIMESSRITKGNDFGIFDLGFIRIGIGICYDIRFPEYSLLLRKEHNIDMMIYPAAFNTVTGPLHWELLARSRAIDNQVYLALCSPSRNYDDLTSYQCYGHSIIVEPNGQVLTTTGYEEDIIYSKLDLSKVSEFRQSIPIWDQKRWDLYNLTKTETN
jgi:omega-amidase